MLLEYLLQYKISCLAISNDEVPLIYNIIEYNNNKQILNLKIYEKAQNELYFLNKKEYTQCALISKPSYKFYIQLYNQFFIYYWNVKLIIIQDLFTLKYILVYSAFKDSNNLILYNKDEFNQLLQSNNVFSYIKYDNIYNKYLQLMNLIQPKLLLEELRKY